MELAEAWLALAERVGISEVDGDVDAARAYIELQAGDAQAALARLGAEETSAIVGSARVVADLLRVEALERLGRGGEAYRLHRIAARAHGNAQIASIATRYALAAKSRAKMVRVGFAALAFLLLVIPVAGLAIQARNWTAIAILDVVLVPLACVLAYRRIRMRRRVG
jgi:hypothetical protein